MDSYKLMELTPAERFEDAHLLGNGSLGASVYGGVPYEKILINHDTLWSGQENDKISQKTLSNFPKARQLVLEGKLREATDLINDEMLGYWSESYLPLGHLHLVTGHRTDLRPQSQKRVLLGEYPIENYNRTLTLQDAVERISYDYTGRHYTREMFVSYPDQILAVRLTASGGSLDFSLSMDSPLRHEQLVLHDGFGITGRAPDRVEPYGPVFQPETVYHPDTNSIRFAAFSQITETDGEISQDGLRLYVKNASYAVILMSADTNYAGFRIRRNRDVSLVLEKCRQRVEQAAKKGYTKLLAAHVADYQALYGRFQLDLGEEITGSLPTTQRLARMRNIDDPSIIALITQYVRYLLIAFSRPGSQAGNLQGIWNPHTAPSWASNYTTNINVQMNYWPAEILNLSDCHEPMFDLIRECAKAGEIAAKELYGMPGWVTHHNTDLWRFSALAGEDASWAWWAFGGFWMCEHLWQHYAFTQDTLFLQNTVYPILHSAAEFLCAFVVKDSDGHYVTAPSTSPENKFFIGDTSIKDAITEIYAGNRMSPNREDTAEVCKASTMDLAIIRELLGNLQQAAQILQIDDPLSSKIEEVLQNLLPFQIGKNGTLQEWDTDFEECTPGMAHVSHLYTIYPSGVIDQKQPELFEAARQSLIRRTQHAYGDSVGWPGSWKISLYARFGDAVQCNLINSTLSSNLSANLLTRGHLQIDAIMGWGAGIAEMLLQSHSGIIRLLPAVAPSWRSGNVKGLCARGGVVVDIQWEHAHLTKVKLTARHSGSYHIVYGKTEVCLELKAGESVQLDSSLKTW